METHDQKTPPQPGSKIAERTISRKSSSGVGSQSARSEDELFADAVTDFVDSPGLGEASYGVISQGNSLLNVAVFKLESPQLKEKNEGDNLTASTILPTDKELPTANAKALEGEFNEMEAMLSHDHISRPNNNMDGSGMEEHKVDTSSNETVHQRIPGSKHSTGAFALGDVIEESLDPVTLGGNVEVRGNVTTEFKDMVEGSHDVGNPENFQDPVHSVQDVEPADENAVKVAAVFEECNLRTEANENVHAVAVHDALCLPENPDIAVENLDHKGGKFNVPMDSDATLTVESLDFGKSNAAEESYMSTGFARSGESDYVSSVGDAPKSLHSMEDVVVPELGPNKSMVEKHTVGQEVQISDVKASYSDIVEFSSKDVLEDIEKEGEKDQDVSSCTEQKPIVSSENFPSKDEAAYYGDDDQEMTAKEDNTSDDFKHEDKKFMVDDNLFTLTAVELAVTSPTSAKSFELTTDHVRDDISEKVNIHDAALNGSKVRIGGEKETDPIEARTASDRGLTISGYSDKNDEFFELENENDEVELSNNLVSDNEMVGDSQPESLPSSLSVREFQAFGDNMQVAQSNTGDTTSVAEKSVDHIDSVLKTSEDAGSSCPSSDVTNRGVKRAADNVPSVTEGDKITKKHTSVLEPNTSESSSQTDSLEGNWGSVSVLSAKSDASPATDIASSKNLQALFEEPSVGSDPKVGEEVPQHCEDKTRVESESHPRVAVEESAGTSEIQAQQQSCTGDSHLVSHDGVGGKREKENMGKVNDWESGKQHSALKTFLGEAIARSRAESPNHDEEDSASVPKTNEVSSQTENVTLVSKEEIGKEWDSPARYPVNIKTEKKRTKNRTYWVPFLCCSSVNAR